MAVTKDTEGRRCLRCALVPSIERPSPERPSFSLSTLRSSSLYSDTIAYWHSRNMDLAALATTLLLPSKEREGGIQREIRRSILSTHRLLESRGALLFSSGLWSHLGTFANFPSSVTPGR